MKLLHLSDLHYCRSYPADGGPHIRVLEEGKSLVERLRWCAAGLGGETPDVLALTGDLTDYGGAEDYQDLRTAVEEVFPGVPVVAIPGNHDHKDVFRSAWYGAEAETSPWDRVEEIKGWTFLSLDSSRQGSNDGVIDEAQCDWLAGQLERAGGRPTLLLTHFHLLAGQHNMPPAVWPQALARVVGQSGVAAVLTGHTHASYAGFFAGKPYFSAPGLGFRGYPDGEGTIHFGPCKGYHWYEFDSNGLVSVRSDSSF